MNDPQFIEAARHLAANAILEGGKDPKKRADYLARRVLARNFKEPEHKILGRSKAAFSKTFRADPEAAKQLLTIGDSPLQEGIPIIDLATWTMVASQVLNFDEAITKH